MSILSLLRHAKSDWHAGVHDDAARPLSARGRRDAPRMGKWLMQQDLIPEIILCSSALRARETVGAVNESLRLPPARIIYTDVIYAAGLDELLHLIEQYSPAYDHILLAGHNPGLDELLCFLSRGQAPYSATGKLMSTAAVAVLRYADGRISARPGSADLVQLMRPRELPA